MAAPVRVVLVDDHAMILAGLQAMLSGFSGRVRVIGQAAEPASATRLVTTLRPDIVLLDVRLGAHSGLDLCRSLSAAAPASRVVFLSVYDDEQYVFEALRAGAAGYLLKRVDGIELVRRLEEVAGGETVVDPTLAGRMAASVARLNRGEFWPGAHRGLTQRESEVLSLLVGGLSNRAIAGRLHLSEETVKSHLRTLYRKLEVADRAAAIAVALREGLFR
ncbi:LuxR family two component transcriptional regulator [Actinocorallia herbida]|uniref:LuxR family two component transcriptional regulator n=1 Tax=Actinocorallia herbida TaxID=58109 RepID=A0A3N1D713_9ACTN|nr:response regulator transcription factor [Actinocorallia herbida]ROO89325.1 LuxR family two component transcriptional regulator [Actinocorallia herbida]